MFEDMDHGLFFLVSLHLKPWIGGRKCFDSIRRWQETAYWTKKLWGIVKCRIQVLRVKWYETELKNDQCLDYNTSSAKDPLDLFRFHGYFVVKIKYSE